ncbi:MAG: glycosyltransferase family 4 protein [Chloroflexi bacterium]|nr:glycosyltransferase family 4 protein [Chloroflexota bacterium]
MRIGLDLRAAQHEWLGGLYYLQNLVRAVKSLPEEEQPNLFGLLAVDQPEPRSDLFEALIDLVPFRGGDPGGSLKAKVGNRLRYALSRNGEVPFGIERAVLRHEIELLFPTLKSRVGSKAAHLPWVQDLQHLHHPEYFSQAELSFRERTFRRLAAQAQHIVVSSEAAAGDFAGRYPKSEPKLRILRFTTVSDVRWFDHEPGTVVARYELPEEFLLLPGQFWRHKNHRLAFEAVRLLHDRGVDVCLVCTGRTEDYRWPHYFAELRADLDRWGLRQHVRVLGIVPRNDYVQLLRASRTIVQPSLFEGWSSIVEDARALAKPIILSDIPVHLEQAPESASYFPRHDAAALADTILEHMSRPPRITAEEEAHVAQEKRVESYARTFVGIAHEAVETRPLSR